MKQAHVLPLLVSIVPALAQSGAFTYLGCYSDDTNSRGLTGQSNAVPASQNSIETCAAACTAYTYFGVEWAVECYCGNTINPPSTLQAGTSGDQTGCGMACQGNSSEICGGGLRVSIYQNTNPGSSSSSSSTTSLTTSGMKSSSSAVASSSQSPTSVSPSSVTSSNVPSSKAPSSNAASSNTPQSSGKPSTSATAPASSSSVLTTSGSPLTSTSKASTPNSLTTSSQALATSSKGLTTSSASPPSSSSTGAGTSTSSKFLTSTKPSSTTAPMSSTKSSSAAAVSSIAASGSGSQICQKLSSAFSFLEDEIAMFKSQGVSVPPYLAGFLSAFQTAQKASGC